MLPLDCTDPERPKAGALEEYLRTPRLRREAAALRSHPPESTTAIVRSAVRREHGAPLVHLLGGIRYGRDLRAAISRARWAVARLERWHRRDAGSLAQRRSSVVLPQYGSTHHGGDIEELHPSSVSPDGTYVA